VIAERADRNSTHLRIFSGQVVSRNHALHFVSQRLIQSALAGNGGLARSFGSTAGLKNLAATLRLEASHLSSTLALVQRPM
jgi:hypothetical protein